MSAPQPTSWNPPSTKDTPPNSVRENLRSADAWPIVKAAVNGWMDDKAASMGAALAYYTLFSMAPLLLIAISVAGLVFGAEAARGEIVGQLASVVGADAARAVEHMLDSASQPAEGLAGALGGVLLTLVGATTVLAELQDALDRIWRAPPSRSKPWWQLVRARLLSFGLILGLGFLMMVSMLASAAITAMQRWSAAHVGDWGMAMQVVNLALNFVFVTVLFAMIYKLMPRVRIAWSDVWIGALTTAVLFTVGRLLIGMYLSDSALVSGFGAAGSLAAILVWVYYSAQIFLLGAEFTWAYAHHAGSRRHLALPPAPLNSATEAAPSYNETPSLPMRGAQAGD
ncbi:MAG TPA: YihY/virulence factor BrkB family protein [Aquabacterium sp.]|nr:YihY/virulence factor BrkB family protein [Aquabacterium sp.]HQC94864.1 YihY/virulence factor BrkB family protein [Aquabacterium sp.]